MKNPVGVRQRSRDGGAELVVERVGGHVVERTAVGPNVRGGDVLGSRLEFLVAPLG